MVLRRGRHAGWVDVDLRWQGQWPISIHMRKAKPKRWSIAVHGYENEHA